VTRFVAGRVAEIPPGSRKIARPHGGQGIGIFNVAGRFYALKNVCPHQGAQLCLGRVTGTTEARARPDGSPEVHWVRDGEIIRCPWHHWEFEIATGRTVFPSRNRVATYDVEVEHDIDRRLLSGVETYPVRVEDGLVVVELPDQTAPKARMVK
jgi:nitrite reductase (NADH) small subunit